MGRPTRTTRTSAVRGQERIGDNAYEPLPVLQVSTSAEFPLLPLLLLVLRNVVRVTSLYQYHGLEK